MRRTMWMGAAVLGAALMAGCGSTPPDSRSSWFEVDRDKMSMVEGAAVETGVRVYWINPPLKPRQ